MQLQLDAQATEGMLLRQGAGRLKHLTVRTIWVQSALVEHQIKVVKLPRALIMLTPCAVFTPRPSSIK